MASVEKILSVAERIAQGRLGSIRGARKGVLAVSDQRVIFWAAHGGLPVVDAGEDKPSMLDFWTKTIRIRFFEDGTAERLLEAAKPGAQKVWHEFSRKHLDWSMWRGDYCHLPLIECRCPECGAVFEVNESGRVVTEKEEELDHEFAKPWPTDRPEPMLLKIRAPESQWGMVLNAWYVKEILECAAELGDPVRVGTALMPGAPSNPYSILYVAADDESWKFGLMVMRVDPSYEHDETIAKIEVKEIEE